MPLRPEAWLRTLRIVPLLAAHLVAQVGARFIEERHVRSWRSSLKRWHESSSLKSGTVYLWRSLLMHLSLRSPCDVGSILLGIREIWEIFFVILLRPISSGTYLVAQVGVKNVHWRPAQNEWHVPSQRQRVASNSSTYPILHLLWPMSVGKRFVDEWHVCTHHHILKWFKLVQLLVLNHVSSAQQPIALPNLTRE